MTYASIDQAKAYLPGEDQRSSNDLNIAMALDTACAAIDRFCGRTFTKDTTASARTFSPLTTGAALVDDFWSTSGLIIKTDDDDDGTYETTWSTSDYELRPSNGGTALGITGSPYWELVAVDSRSFTMLRRRSLQVTAKWGWQSVPDPVVLATLNLTGTIRKLRDVPLGLAGFQDFGGVRVPVDVFRQVAGLLVPYRRTERVVGIG